MNFIFKDKTPIGCVYGLLQIIGPDDPLNEQLVINYFGVDEPKLQCDQIGLFVTFCRLWIGALLFDSERQFVESLGFTRYLSSPSFAAFVGQLT